MTSKFPIFMEKIENDIKNSEDFVDFCKGNNARYGFSEFYTNMVGACLFNSSPAASASVLRLAGELKDLRRSPMGEWMRRRMETADAERVCHVFHDRTAAAYRRAVEMGPPQFCTAHVNQPGFVNMFPRFLVICQSCVDSYKKKRANAQHS